MDARVGAVASRRLARTRWGIVLACIALAVILLIVLFLIVARPSSKTPVTQAIDNSALLVPSGPPWIYGRRDARFTVVEYADLECAYCRAYFLPLRRWIDQNPQANWQWHHLPLTSQAPRLSQAARAAECAGEVNGNDAFWLAIEWIYGHPVNTRLPNISSAMTECLRSERPDQQIVAQMKDAAIASIAATPTLRIVDRVTNKDLILQGPIEGDALLSAIDLLTTPSAEDVKQIP